MKLTREVKFSAWVLAAVIIAAGSYFVGSSLKPSEEPFYVFETTSPAHQPAVTIPALSQAGFTGFGEFDGSGSRTVIGGRVVEQGESSLTLETPDGHRTRLTFGSEATISRLQTASVADIEPGASVSILLAADAEDAVAAVLILD